MRCSWTITRCLTKKKGTKTTSLRTRRAEQYINCMLFIYSFKIMTLRLCLIYPPGRNRSYSQVGQSTSSCKVELSTAIVNSRMRHKSGCRCRRMARNLGLGQHSTANKESFAIMYLIISDNNTNSNHTCCRRSLLSALSSLSVLPLLLGSRGAVSDAMVGFSNKNKKK